MQEKPTTLQYFDRML